MKALNKMLMAVSFFGSVFLVGIFDKKTMTTLGGGDPMSASVFFTQSVKSEDLRVAYNSVSSTTKKLNVLLVPGHEPKFGGAEYRGILERDLNADLALYLAQYLVEDGHFEVVMTRGKDGWNPHIEDYFNTSTDEIKTFVRKQKIEMLKLVSDGRIITIDGTVQHNDAPSDVALRLFGINKWANEHMVDIVIHIHFNDNSPRKTDAPGEYNGFSIYIPERQYSNSLTSLDISKHFFNRLSKMFPVSDLPGENHGLVEDQALIAVGSNNTVDAASMLIEYGYIYEPQFQTPDVRALVLKELAFQTYLGLSDFFGESSLIVGPHESTLLPYSGEAVVKKTTLANTGVFAFQAALTDKGFYPPENYSRNDCPLSGILGPCTRASLGDFQREFNITGEKGVVGSKTRAQLRKLFEPSLVSKK
ncbi:MAG: N-acetylmuramoyl-L-alanine amidase [Minisyncoccia bacterium]